MKLLPTTGRLLAILFLTSYARTAAAQFGFVVGDYYTANYFSRTIRQYDSGGGFVGSLTLSPALGDEVRGIAFGSDNLLYVTVARDSGFAVLALNNSGIVQQTYSGPVYVGGNISYGKIALDGQYLYVAGQDQLTRFTLGNPMSGTSIYTNNQVFDVKPLPNGDLLVASAYQIDEITTAGTFVRTIPLVGDGNSFTDIRGIEYNAATNDLFVSELGHTDFFFQVMRLDATTGLLEKNAMFTYADDLFLTDSGELLVGSRTETPEFFDLDLDTLRALDDEQQMFVTQYSAVPEPSVTCLVAGGLAFVLIIVRRSCARPLTWRRGPQC